MRTARSELSLAIRHTQRQWLREVVAATGLTPTEIARSGKLNPSTLTRFLKDDQRGTALSSTTIAAIAQVTGIAPPSQQPGHSPPTPPRNLREPDGEPWRPLKPSEPNPALVVAAGNPNAHAWTIQSQALRLAGIMPGDVLIIDQSIQPKDGDVVCAQIEEGLGARTVFRVFRAGMLIGASVEPLDVRPEWVDGERVRVAGVMIGLVRLRR